MFAIQPKPASFTESANSYQVGRNGYIQIDFTPVDPTTNTVVPTGKRTFVLLMKNVGDILDLDTRIAYDKTTDEEGIFVQYQHKAGEAIKVLRMTKNVDSRSYKFTYCEVADGNGESGTPANAISIDLSYGEVRNIQTLIEYSIPLILGWHCIYNPSVVATA